VAETLARGEPVRKDDNPEAFKTRLVAYREQTGPALRLLRQKGLLRVLDGMRPIDEVTEAISRILHAEAA
jgi:adenylate kinase